MRPLELNGKKFGRLTVNYRVGNIKGKSAWKCTCECGKEVIVTGRNLVRGNTLSCGCYRKEQIKKAVTKTGMSQSRIYHIWQGMKQRCFDEKRKNYERYGGRGISVCNEWKDSFPSFYEHVSNLQHFGEPGYTLDRINNDGNYEPGNVRWATAKEQANNKRNSRRKVTI